MLPDAASGTMVLVPILIWLAFAITLLAVYAGSVAWLVGDAHQRGYSGIAPFFLLWICWPVSALIWILVHPRIKLVERPVDDYANADDALVAASKLDMLGEWDGAIALYQQVAARWPEHENYVRECIKAIDGKMAARKP
jgi:hypothetical protein